MTGDTQRIREWSANLPNGEKLTASTDEGARKIVTEWFLDNGYFLTHLGWNSFNADNSPQIAKFVHRSGTRYMCAIAMKDSPDDIIPSHFGENERALAVRYESIKKLPKDEIEAALILLFKDESAEIYYIPTIGGKSEIDFDFTLRTLVFEKRKIDVWGL